jgi:hypothetical protein
VAQRKTAESVQVTGSAVEYFLLSKKLAAQHSMSCFSKLMSYFFIFL